MKWIIKRISSGEYAASPRLFVKRRAFARRFSTKKQAEAYMISSSFSKKDHVAEEIDDETEIIENMDNTAYKYVKE